jgi:hypothetical protein
MRQTSKKPSQNKKILPIKKAVYKRQQEFVRTI